jgi:hypothetical protein
MELFFSIIVTENPALAKYEAALIPAIPAPITTAFLFLFVKILTLNYFK